MSAEPESVILGLLRQMRAELATKADVQELRSGLASVESDMESLRAEVKSGMGSP